MGMTMTVCPFCDSPNFEITEVTDSVDGFISDIPTGYICCDCQRVFITPKFYYVEY